MMKYMGWMNRRPPMTLARVTGATPGVAFVATLFSLVATAVQAASSLFILAPLVLLDGSPYLSAFTTTQLQAMVLLFLKLSAQSGSIQLAFLD